METKTCFRCKITKYLEEFSKVNKGKYIQSWCKDCMNIYSRRRNTYKKQHKEYLMLSGAKLKAKKKGLEFDLTIEDIIIPETCPLLNIPLGKKNVKISENSPTLDRIDNSKGYIKGNIWVISNRANKMKGDFSIKEFKTFLSNLCRLANLEYSIELIPKVCL